MCALFHDAAVVDNDYVVCVLDGGEAVSDDDAGTALLGSI